MERSSSVTLAVLWTFIQGAVSENCYYNYFSYKYCVKCCGSYGSQYCCFSDPTVWNSGMIAGVVIGGVVFVGICIAVGVALMLGKNPLIMLGMTSPPKNRKTTTTVRAMPPNRTSNTVVVTTTSTAPSLPVNTYPPPYVGSVPGCPDDPVYPPPPNPYIAPPQPFQAPYQAFQGQQPYGNPPPYTGSTQTPQATVFTVQQQ